MDERNEYEPPRTRSGSPDYTQPPIAFGEAAAATRQRQPKRKRTTPLWVTITVGVVALVVGMAAGGSKSKQDTAGQAAAGAATVYVTVTESAPAAVTTKPAPAAVTTKPAAAATTKAPAVPPPTTAAAPATKVVLHVSGSGTKTTAKFTVGPDWSLTYTFDCSNFGSSGNFQVFEDAGAGSVLANALAAKGADKTYQHADGGSHSLEVNSECGWTITVTDGDGG